MPPPTTLLPSLEATPEAPTFRASVLLVEDEEALAELLQHLMRRMKVRVLHAPDAATALQLIEAHRSEIAMAYVDCNLPDMPGAQLCELLRSSTPGLPLLLTSGRDQRALERVFAPGGPCTFLPKPYLPAEVMGRVNAMLPPAA